MRAKLVEQIGAVIGQCARRAIHIGRVEQINAIVRAIRRACNAHRIRSAH